MLLATNESWAVFTKMDKTYIVVVVCEVIASSDVEAITLAQDDEFASHQVAIMATEKTTKE